MTLASLFGLSSGQALLLIFIVLPFVVAGPVIAFVSWRSSGTPPPVRTSTILAEGDPAEGEVLSVKLLGTFLDMRPMVRFSLRVHVDGESAFDLEVVQSLPRGVARDYHTGDLVELRLTHDRSAGAVVWVGPYG